MLTGLSVALSDVQYAVTPRSSRRPGVLSPTSPALLSTRNKSVTSGLSVDPRFSETVFIPWFTPRRANPAAESLVSASFKLLWVLGFLFCVRLGMARYVSSRCGWVSIGDMEDKDRSITSRMLRGGLSNSLLSKGERHGLGRRRSVSGRRDAEKKVSKIQRTWTKHLPDGFVADFRMPGVKGGRLLVVRESVSMAISGRKPNMPKGDQSRPLPIPQ